MSDQIKPSTVAEIRQMADAAVVMCFIGQIKKRFKRSAGTNSHGDWSFENFEMADTTGQLIKVKFKDWEPLDVKYSAGTSMSILATKSDKHGWIGVKAKDDDNKGDIERILYVTSSAVINVQASPQASAQEKPKPFGTRQPPPDAPPEMTGEQRAAEDLHEARRRQIQLVNLMDWNLDGAAWLAERFNEKHPKLKPMDTEDVRQMAATLQIGCEHAQCPQRMPSTIVKDKPKGKA